MNKNKMILTIANFGDNWYIFYRFNENYGFKWKLK